MSRTYRRQSGDRTFADLNAKNVQNPWHYVSRFTYKCVSKDVCMGVRFNTPYMATRYWYETQHSYVISGLNKPRPLELDKLSHLADKLQRDHKCRTRRCYKKVCSKLRRNDAKQALIKSIKTGESPVLSLAGTYRDWGYYS